MGVSDAAASSTTTGKRAVASDHHDTAVHNRRCARRACFWANFCIEIVDDTDELRYPNGAPRLSTFVPAVKAEDEGDEVTDVMDWSDLEGHVRNELQLSHQQQLILIFEHEVLKRPLRLTGSSSMSILYRLLDTHAAKMDECIVLHAQLTASLPDVQPMATDEAPIPPLVSMSPDAMQLTAEALGVNLQQLIYPRAKPRERASEGVWTAACHELMLRNPKHLLLFDELRHEGVGRALGSGSFLVNPIRAACPCCGDVCALGKANELHNLLTHLVKCKAPSAATIYRRLKLANNHLLISAAELDECGGRLESTTLSRLPPTDRADFYSRDLPSQWYRPWLEQLLAWLTTQHVVVQMLLALLYCSVGWSTLRWARHVPVLLMFAHQIYYTARPAGLNLMRGRTFHGKGRTGQILLRAERFESMPGEGGMILCHVPRAPGWLARLDSGTQFTIRLDGVITVELVGPPQINVESGSALLTLCMIEGASDVVLCATNVDLVRVRALQPSDVNLMLPSQGTLRADELPPTYTTSTHLHKIGALLTMGKSLPSIPALRSSKCIVVLVGVQFDERPLNKGAFVRIDPLDGVWAAQLHGVYEKADDGTPRPITPERAHALLAEGNSATRKALTSAIFTSSVKEYMAQTLDGALKMNIRTEYVVLDEKHMDVRAALKAARSEMRVCLACIEAGCACEITQIGEACATCERRGCQCVYASDVFDLCDQGSAQRKAFGELNSEINAMQEELQVDSSHTLLNPRYQRVGHGMLHGAKNCVGSTRNYRLTDGSTGEFSVRTLLAVATSDSPAAAQLAAAASRDVFKALDRHSDQIAYETVHKPIQDVLRSVGHVKDTLLPEPYKTWSTRCENHDTLSRPTSVAFNTRGEGIFCDADGHVIGMFTRHWPAKVSIVAGTWGETGRARSGDVLGTEVKLHRPMQLAVLVVTPGKDERAFFGDLGNGALRVVSGVHDVDATHKVSTVVLMGDEKVYATGLAVVRGHDESGKLRPLLALCEREPARLKLIQLDEGCKSGALLAHVWPLQSPWGLGVRDGVVFAADGAKVRYCKVAEAARRPTAAGVAGRQLPQGELSPNFREARAVALSGETLAVADYGSHTILLYRLSGLAATPLAQWGTGVAANLDGPIAAAAFDEPCCLAFSCGTLLIGCYGGEAHGTISVVTPTAFAARLLESIEAIYKAIGFVDNRLRGAAAEQARLSRDQPLHTATQQLQTAVDFLLSIPEARSQALSGLMTDGPEGSLHRHSIEGMHYTVKHVCALADDLEAAGVDTSTVTLRALLNESVVERAFGHQSIMTQADHPTQKEYAASKPKADRSTLNQLATPAFSFFTSLWSQYMAPHVSQVSAAQLYQLMARLYGVIRPRPAEPSETEKAALRKALHNLRTLAELAGQQRCAAARAKYKRPCGVRPTVFVNTQATWAAEQPAHQLTTFTDEVTRLMRTRTAVAPAAAAQIRADANYSRDEYLFKSGDIGFIKGGIIRMPDGREIADAEDFWAFQVREAFDREHMRPGCSVKLFWLQRAGRSNKWSLLPNSADTIRYARLLMEDGEPIVVREETLLRGWDCSRGTVFELSDELVEQLTEVAHAWGRVPTRTLRAEPEPDQGEQQNEAGDGTAGGGVWEQEANDAPHAETRMTLLEAVREGGLPPGRRPERQCRRIEPYGR